MIEEIAKSLFEKEKQPSRGRPKKIHTKEWDELTDDDKKDYISTVEMVIQALEETGRKILQPDVVIKAVKRSDPTGYGDRFVTT